MSSAYNDTKNIYETWQGEVCVFGAGLIGSTWGYDIIEATGIAIDFL